ncbi:hypothetical protein Tco_0023489, partial [Tanacetum coccineum]
DMSILPREPPPCFGIGSPSILINNKPPLIEAKPLDTMNLEQLVEKNVDSGGSPTHEEMLEVGTGSIAERMKSRKCRTKGSTKPPVN